MAHRRPCAAHRWHRRWQRQRPEAPRGSDRRGRDDAPARKIHPVPRRHYAVSSRPTDRDETSDRWPRADAPQGPPSAFRHRCRSLRTARPRSRLPPESPPSGAMYPPQHGKRHAPRFPPPGQSCQSPRTPRPRYQARETHRLAPSRQAPPPPPHCHRRRRQSPGCRQCPIHGPDRREDGRPARLPRQGPASGFASARKPQAARRTSRAPPHPSTGCPPNPTCRTCARHTSETGDSPLAEERWQCARTRQAHSLPSRQPSGR